MNGEGFGLLPGEIVLARDTELCPDCRASLIHVGFVGNRPALVMEHADTCPWLTRMEQAEAARRGQESHHDDHALRGTR